MQVIQIFSLTAIIVICISSCFDTVKVTVDENMLLGKLRLDSLEKFPVKNYRSGPPFNILDSLYSHFHVDTVYLADKKIKGFNFAIESSFFGYALVNYSDKSKITSIFFYNMLDMTLINGSRPSTAIYFFKDGERKYLFDGYNNQMYSLKNNLLLQTKEGW